MKLLTKAQHTKLRSNWDAHIECINLGRPSPDPLPVVKLFTPWGGGTWLITEMDPDGLLFGLCDLGHGEPELGYVDLEELRQLRGPGGLQVERDRWFTADKSLSAYLEEARKLGRIAA